MSGLGYRVLGFGLWYLRRLGRSGSRFAGALLVSLAAAALACSSQSEPAPTTDAGVTSSGTTDSATQNGALLSSLGTQFSVADLVEAVRPSVASIAITAASGQGQFFLNDEGAGSGIVVRPDGYIVTNYHVVQLAEQITVNLSTGESYGAEIVGSDRLSDLAVIKIDAVDLPAAAFADSATLRVGDWVLAVGNVLALRGGPTVTLGIASAVGRTVDTEQGTLYDMIQTDAAINEGNSGGPLLNLSGEVVGISTAILRQAQGIGFAVSSSVAVPIIDSLIDRGHVVRPLIGLVGQDINEAIANRFGLAIEAGIIITGMSRDGPAYSAGLRPGDVITKVDGVATADMAGFLTHLWTYEVGEVVLVEYLRETQTFVTSVELAERPPFR